ncbi:MULTISPECIES: HNH endonuclease [unclassified Rhizobium]|uniref:HNH endonuclease n=1 Tax=unclassified Rhizobium TaxID=2613769 RepID=UPI000A6044A2|nr:MULTISPECIES: HNH endonuclease [unclassified Rhizobium]
MIYVEMARDVDHGGEGWSFPSCLWAPTLKETGAHWPFWTNVKLVKSGDIILHIRGKKPASAFVGLSIASSDGYETTRRPPVPGKWAYSKSFYRADLHQYVPFPEPINLDLLFLSKKQYLEDYAKNKKISSSRSNLFYVIQSGRLQCQNGGYLSGADDALLDILFGMTIDAASKHPPVVSTSEVLREIKARVGQQLFSAMIKSNYNNSCCFPQCGVVDSRFLVAAHIARWSDNKRLRGHAGNGLCLCLMHDKAFELGMFTLDQNFAISIQSGEIGVDQASQDLLAQNGKVIKLGLVPPCEEALAEHRVRTNFHGRM